MKFLTLLYFLVCMPLFAQSTGPVYNFNFYNKEVNLPGSVPVTQPGTPSSSPAPLAGNISQEVKPSSKNYFSRSLLNPEDNYLGLIGTYIHPLQKKGDSKANVMSGNLLFSSSLWGVKYINFNMDRMASDDNIQLLERSSKFGINKFIPYSNNIALELGAFYEKGHVTTWGPDYNDIEYSTSFNAGSALVGLNFFTGNFIAGIQWEQRFLFKADNNNFDWRETKKRNLLSANLGLYF